VAPQHVSQPYQIIKLIGVTPDRLPALHEFIAKKAFVTISVPSGGDMRRPFLKLLEATLDPKFETYTVTLEMKPVVECEGKKEPIKQSQLVEFYLMCGWILPV
jgi:hypothetical protein